MSDACAKFDTFWEELRVFSDDGPSGSAKGPLAEPIRADDSCAAAAKKNSGVIGLEESVSENEDLQESVKSSNPRDPESVESSDPRDSKSSSSPSSSSSSSLSNVREDSEREEEEEGEAERRKRNGRRKKTRRAFDCKRPPAYFITPESVIGVSVVCRLDFPNMDSLPTVEQIQGLTESKNVLLAVSGLELALQVHDRYAELTRSFKVKVYALSEENSAVRNMNIAVQLGCAHGFDLVEFFRLGAQEFVPADVSVFAKNMESLETSLIVRCTNNSIVTWGWVWAAGVVEGKPTWGGGGAILGPMP
jgi:hypothetical protein